MDPQSLSKAAGTSWPTTSETMPSGRQCDEQVSAESPMKRSVFPGDGLVDPGPPRSTYGRTTTRGARSFHTSNGRYESMLIKILIGLVVIIVVFVGIVTLRPSEFRVERSAVVSAPPAVVFAQVNDLRKWEAWSPWVKLDPSAKLPYDGSPPATGAGSAWAGNH